MPVSTTNTWRNLLLSHWEELEIPKFLYRIGVDYQLDFVNPLNHSHLKTNPYSMHDWTLMENSHIPEGVLHLCPKNIGDNQVFWEEWFLLEDGIHHHVLSNNDFLKEQGVWTPPPGDVDHPTIVLNTSWHY
jgi:hypothetical protein